MSAHATYPSLAGRAVLITGGATGIGAGLVEAFAAQGARVAFLDVDGDAGEALAGRLAGAPGGRPWFRRCDLRDVDALRAAVNDAAADLGAFRALVNNAGRDTRHRLEDLDPSGWDDNHATNLRPHFFAAQAVRPAMRDAGGGSIINMSSNSWLLGLDGYPAYVTAKAGIVGLTKALARELGGEAIRVNAVLPGWVMTRRQVELWLTEEGERELMTQQAVKRRLAPEDVARLVLFLAADDSAMITGQSHVVDGGRV